MLQIFCMLLDESWGKSCELCTQLRYNLGLNDRLDGLFGCGLVDDAYLKLQ